VVLALGRRGTPRKLEVPGEEHEHVMYQLIDAASYTHQHVLVVGGGDSAIEAATALADQPGNKVYLSYRRPAFVRLKRRNEDRIRAYVSEGRITGFLPSEVVQIDKNSVLLRRGEGAHPKDVTLPVHYVFIFAGGEPPFGVLKEMGVAMGVNRKRHSVEQDGRQS
jgi:thioredoxin reductase